MTTVENKIPNVSNLVKKTDHNTKVNEIEKKTTHHNHDKYVTTQEFNKLTTENFNARFVQANLVPKLLLIIICPVFDNKLSRLNRIIVSNKTKH